MNNLKFLLFIVWVYIKLFSLCIFEFLKFIYKCAILIASYCFHKLFLWIQIK